jgi:Putative motility protein
MDDFTVAAASAVKQSQVQNQVDIAVASKTLQVQKQQGDAVIQLIDQAVQIQEQLASGHIDVKI